MPLWNKELRSLTAKIRRPKRPNRPTTLTPIQRFSAATIRKLRMPNNINVEKILS
jgi:hypothetical protein